jgi:hypothetical protein
MLFTDRRATIRSVLKVVYFLLTVWGVFLHSHTQSGTKQRIKTFVCHLPTTLVPSLHYKVWISFVTWPNIEILNMANDRRKINVRDFQGCSGWCQIICKVSVGMRVVVKCLRNNLIPCFGAGCVWGRRNIPQTVHVFSCARNIQLLILNKS